MLPNLFRNWYGKTTPYGIKTTNAATSRPSLRSNRKDNNKVGYTDLGGAYSVHQQQIDIELSQGTQGCDSEPRDGVRVQREFTVNY